jgi:predicted pyridoxine 5'-phosphate oxidase superfamily flavin-nucleotide-binding protein
MTPANTWSHDRAAGPARGGFHEGELLVQARADVRREAARLEGMLGPGGLSAGAERFLEQQRLLVIASRDGRGALWVSPVTGSRGFLVGAGGRLEVTSLPAFGDPLAHLVVGEGIGATAIDLATRRRIRVNGAVAGVSPHGFVLRVEECFGNCPQYIQRREVLEVAEAPAPDDIDRARRLAVESAGLAPKIADRIRAADTFFLGTSHPHRGPDCSHRGGAPGFVRVEGNSLWWPDYHGNNMFTSIGNLAVEPAAALLFVDFELKQMIHLSGTASVEFDEPGRPGDDDRTGRRVRFEVDRSVVVQHPGLQASQVTLDERNPAVSG